MGSLSLHLSHPQVWRRFGEEFGIPAGWTLRWRVSLERFNRVELSNGADLSKMVGALSMIVGEIVGAEIEDDPDAIVKPGPPIGALVYQSINRRVEGDTIEPHEADHYEVRLLVTKTDLTDMIDRVLAGQGPNHIHVSVPRLDWGNLPGGEWQRWDIEKHSSLYVDGASFSFGKEHDDIREDPVTVGPPPPPPPSEEAKAMIELTRYVKQGGPWLLMLLGLIFFALIVRR